MIIGHSTFYIFHFGGGGVPLAVCVVEELVAHGRMNEECRMKNVEGGTGVRR